MSNSQPKVTINTSFDYTQRQLVVDIAAIIYRSQGYDITDKSIDYLFNSHHPQERSILNAAERIFEIFAGDLPSYEDDDLEL
ncbi:MAG: hypothetical protein F6K42_25890 [Leptolyngbya sp. SIO1D8]|nr:hypothetical protein [Leptolyngbya sp. SIO1D8]